MILLVTPTAMEMSALLANKEHTFSSYTLEQAQAGYIEQGYIASTPLAIGICGVGPLLSGMTVTQWGMQYTITALILCGIAGSYSLSRYPLLSTLFITKDIYIEYGRRSQDGVTIKNFPFPHDAKRAIYNTINVTSPQIILEALGLQYHVCAEVVGTTVAGVSADSNIAHSIYTSYPDIAVETMEGFSVALACTRYNIPFIHLRTISNEVGNTTEWEIAEALSHLSTTLSLFLE